MRQLVARDPLQLEREAREIRVRSNVIMPESSLCSTVNYVSGSAKVGVYGVSVRVAQAAGRIRRPGRDGQAGVCVHARDGSD